MRATPHTLSDLETLFARVSELEQKLQDLQETRVPAVVPLKDFPDWYQRATNSPEPPVTEGQLRNWVSRERHYGVDWVVRDGRAVLVDAQKFISWRRRMGSRVRAREGVRG